MRATIVRGTKATIKGATNPYLSAAAFAIRPYVYRMIIIM
jgi:hypothetical protein